MRNLIRDEFRAAVESVPVPPGLSVEFVERGGVPLQAYLGSDKHPELATVYVDGDATTETVGDYGDLDAVIAWQRAAQDAVIAAFRKPVPLPIPDVSDLPGVNVERSAYDAHCLFVEVGEHGAVCEIKRDNGGCVVPQFGADYDALYTAGRVAERVQRLLDGGQS